MSVKVNVVIFMGVISLLFIKEASCTIDLNAAELQYLADHLTPEECRRLIAAAHFKTYQEPNAWDQAERKISSDMPCIDLLHHWNSESGEGKGETHEVLEHRLRQMEKYALADWLGRTVFHELGKDLNRSLEGLHQFVTEENTQELFIAGPTLVPIVEKSDPTKWTAMDSLLYAIVVGLIIVIVILCAKVCYTAICRYKRARKRKVTTQNYDTWGEQSSSESEDKFDVRDYSENKALI